MGLVFPGPGGEKQGKREGLPKRMRPGASWFLLTPERLYFLKQFTLGYNPLLLQQIDQGFLLDGIAQKKVFKGDGFFGVEFFGHWIPLVEAPFGAGVQGACGHDLARLAVRRHGSRGHLSLPLATWLGRGTLQG